MIDSDILTEVEEVLGNLLDSLPEKKDIQIDNSEENATPNQFTQILNLASELISNLEPTFHQPIDKYVQATKYMQEHSEESTSPAFKSSAFIRNQQNYKNRVTALGNINLINETEQDELRLAILIQFFDNLAHLRDHVDNRTTKAIIAPSYSIKDKLMKYLQNEYPDKTCAIDSNGRQNANISFFLFIDNRFLAWHSQDVSLIQFNSEVFFAIVEKALSSSPKYRSRTFKNLKEMLDAFTEADFQDNDLQQILELNNTAAIDTLVRDEKEKRAASKKAQKKSNAPTKSRKTTEKVKENSETPNVDKLLDYLEPIELAESAEDLSEYIKDTNWGEFSSLSEDFSTLSRRTRKPESIERIVALASIINNLIDSYPGLESSLSIYRDSLCSSILEKNGTVVEQTKRGNTEHYLILNSDLTEEVDVNGSHPKIKIKLRSDTKFSNVVIKCIDGRKKINSLTYPEISSSFFEDTKQHSEFIGGGTYEEKVLGTHEEPIISDNIKPDTACRNPENLWEAIFSSDNGTIQKLLPLLDSHKSHNGFNMAEISKMEILQTAFNSGIISSEEFESQQLESLSSIISSAGKKERIEIKSCGETSKKKDNSLVGQFLAIRIQNALTGKPLFYKISEETKTELQKRFPDIKLSPGNAIHSINNLEILEKLSAGKSKVAEISSVEKEEPKTLPESSEPTNEMSEGTDKYGETAEVLPNDNNEHIENHQTPLPLFTAGDLDDFLSQKDSMERLHNAMKNASPETKAFLAAIIAQLVPESIPPLRRETKPERNGGFSHE